MITVIDISFPFIKLVIFSGGIVVIIDINPESIKIEKNICYVKKKIY